MRYVQIPEPIQLVNPDTDETLPQRCSFADYVRALRRDDRFVRGVDMLEAYDATASLIRGKPGDAVPLQDETWNILQACAKRPTTLGPAIVFSPEGERFVKALTDATTKEPAKT